MAKQSIDDGVIGPPHGAEGSFEDRPLISAPKVVPIQSNGERFNSPPNQSDRPTEINSADGPVLSVREIAACSTREARQLLGFELAKKLSVLPLATIKLPGRIVLSCAAGSGFSTDALKAIKFATGLEARLVNLPTELVRDAIVRAYQGDISELEKTLGTINEGEGSDSSAATSRTRRLPLYPLSGGPARFLAQLVEFALAHEASDIHLSPTSEGATVRLRIDGELYKHDYPLYGINVHEQIIARLRVLCNAGPVDPKLPFDGEFPVEGSGLNSHVRVNIMPTVYGERAVLRLRRGGELLELDKLGLSAAILEKLRAFSQQHDGVLLLCGATGSGKSTTLYAVLNELVRQNRNIVSIEDPVEILLPGIGQTSIDEDRGLTFASALKSALRQDPNVILLGEMRDSESASIAFQAALSGHLLLSTLHTRSATDAFLRLRSLGVDNWSMARSISYILAQQLIPKLCQHCSFPDLASSQHFGFDTLHASGCNRCSGTGSCGRVAIGELLKLDSTLSDIVATGEVDRATIAAHLSGSNFISFSETLEQQARAGLVSGRVAASRIAQFRRG